MEREALGPVQNYVDTLVSNLNQQDRHQRDRFVTLNVEKQGYISERHKQDQWSSSQDALLHQLQ